MATKTKKTTTAATKPAPRKNSISTTKKTATIVRKPTPTRTEAPMIVRPRPVVTEQQIALRAYELFEARGYAHGHDVEDWVQAERQLLAGL